MLKRIEQAEGDDTKRAEVIWRDLVWKVQKTCSTYQEVEALVKLAKERAEQEIVSKVFRSMLLGKFEIMLNRLSEFTPKTEGAPVCCSACGQPLAEDEYKQQVTGQIDGVFLCAKCSPLQ